MSVMAVAKGKKVCVMAATEGKKEQIGLSPNSGTVTPDRRHSL